MDNGQAIDEEEMELLRALRERPEIMGLVKDLCAVGEDRDASCRSADDAEGRIDELGQSLKLGALRSWARSAEASEQRRRGALGRGKRSKKNA